MLEKIVERFKTGLGIGEQAHLDWLANNPEHATISEIAAGLISGIKETEQKIDAVLARLNQDAEFGLYPISPEYAQELVKTAELFQQEVNDDSLPWIIEKADHMYHRMYDSLQEIKTKFAGYGSPNPESGFIRGGYALPIGIAALAGIVAGAFLSTRSTDNPIDNYSIDDALHTITGAIAGLGGASALAGTLDNQSILLNENNTLSDTLQQNEYGSLNLQQVYGFRSGGYSVRPFSFAVSPDNRDAYIIGTLGVTGWPGLVMFLQRSLSSGNLMPMQSLGSLDGVDGLRKSSSVIVSPDGKNVYVAGGIENAIITFQRDLITGELDFLDCIKERSTGMSGTYAPNCVVVSPDNKNVYMVNWRKRKVDVFQRDTTNGILTFLESKVQGVDGISGIYKPGSVLVSPDNKNVYVTGSTSYWDGNNTVVVFQRDLLTGALTPEQVFSNLSRGAGPPITINPDSKHIYVGDGDRIVILERDLANGRLTFLDDVACNIMGIISVEVSQDNRTLYASGYTPQDYYGTYGTDNVHVFERDTVSGMLEFLDSEGSYGWGVGALTLSPDGRNVYAVPRGGPTSVTIYRRNIGEEPDTKPPTFANITPQPYATDIPSNTDISIDVIDMSSGIIRNSLEMLIEGEKVSPVITQLPDGFNLFYDPAQDFNYEQQVDIIVRARDNSQNQGGDSFYFTTASQATPADLAIIDVKAYTNPGDNFAIAGRNSTIEFKIKNVGQEPWNSREVIARAYTVDMLNQGNDGFWSLVMNANVIIDLVYDQKMLSALNPGEERTYYFHDKRFVKPDIIDHLYVDILPAQEGDAVDNNPDNNVQMGTPFEVRLDLIKTLFNCTNELIQTVTLAYGANGVEQGALHQTQTMTEFLNTTYNLALEGKDITSGIQDAYQHILNASNTTDPEERDRELTKAWRITQNSMSNIGVLVKGYTEPESILEQIPFINSVLNEIRGVGCGALSMHYTYEAIDFIKGFWNRPTDENISSILLASPADLYLMEGGNIIASVDTAGNTTAVGNAAAYRIGHFKFINFLADPSKTYTTELVGTETGTLDVIVTQKRDAVERTTYTDIPIQPNHTARLDVGANVIGDILRVYDQNDTPIDTVTAVKEIPPIARLMIYTLNPTTRDTVRFNAGQSQEANEARMDFEGDGTFDTQWRTEEGFSHQYTTAGNYNPTLEVRNADGIDGITKHLIVETPVSVQEPKTQLPTAYTLSQNYPNPFNPFTTIPYTLPEDSPVRLTIYNLQGQVVRTIAQGHQPAGSYNAQWDGKDSAGNQLGSGVYFCNFQAGDFNHVQKMLLLR